MGRGPAVLAHAIRQRFAVEGVPVDEKSVEVPERLTEVGCAFSLAAQIADQVRQARAARAFPVVLAGNCISALGTVAGLDAQTPGVLWLDTHGDLNTPETTLSGFLDGMAVAALTGRCWTSMAAGIPGFRAVADQHVVLAGTRELDPAEESLLSACAITRWPLRAPGMPSLPPSTDALYIHVDLDVLDAGLVGPANGYASVGGCSVPEVVQLVAALGASAPVHALGITAYDPACDPAQRVPAAAAAIALAWYQALAAARVAPRTD
jgi:arginase